MLYHRVPVCPQYKNLIMFSLRKFTPKYSLEEGKTTFSGILAWRISWSEEPGGLQFMGLQRVGHD